MADSKAEVLGQRILEKLSDIIPEFYKEWDIVGFDADTRNQFENSIVDHNKALLVEMLAETKQRKSNLLENIETMTQQLKSLSEELNIEIDLDCGDAVLLDVQRHLETQLEVLTEIKETRMIQFKELIDKENEICSIMGSVPVGLDSTLPSEEQLQQFQLYISKQEAEMIRLKKIFKDTRMEIMKIMDELGYSPKSDFERLVIIDHHNFTFTPTNMKKLEKLNEELKDKLSIAKETAQERRRELLNLLEYLEVPQSDYEDFLESNSGCDATTISALNKEIKKCKEIRMKNIAKYVERIREEIVQLWDLCKFSEKQRDCFKPYQYQNYTEDVLTLHEMEVEELKNFYQKNEKIFNLFQQHQEMILKMQELELKAEDPNRLNNRGGQLLEEEKSRKIITKNLPKTEDKLRELLADYETKHGIPFTFDGLTLDEYIQRQSERFNEEKENMKLARAKAKDEKKSAKKTPLSASRRNITTAMSLRGVHSTVKRKLPMDKSPLSTGIKRNRQVQSEKTRPTVVCGSKIRRSGLRGKRIFSNSLTKDSPRKRKTPKIIVSDATLNLQQYEEFQEHLSSRDELRSTLLSEQLLKTVRTDGKKMKTPVKTPVKPLRKHLVASTSHGTPKSVPRRPSRSPRITSTPKLTAAPANGLSHLKL